MNKKFLAAAIAAATFGTQAVAVELYNNDGTTFSIGGHVSVNLNGSEQGDTDVGTNSPRINFTATQDLGNGFTADARGEWALNYLDGGEETFTTRLGYLGLTHDVYGRAVGGTQWAPYYDVAGVADMPIAFANDFIYDDHGALGTGRADKMLSYRNAIELGEAGAINFGLGWQGAKEDGAEYDDRMQVALSYAIMGAKIGYTYNGGDIQQANFVGKQSAESHLVSAAYGSYGQGLYVAAVYGSNENMNFGTNGARLVESDAYEALLAYALPSSLNLSINYEMVEGKEFNRSKTETAREEMAVQAEYNFTSKFVGYAGYQFDLNDANDRKTDDKWALGARYYL
ncbi:porin [Vibrio sp. B172a]|uniref:porin n=1 Tax=Vibrio TaxID=662 RepID=UPI0002D90CD6|nr:porin [Vibrio sp. B172a]MDK9779918.1 porin [Vibrio sp. B172a]GAK23117.1 outer membrane protein N, non-specific porin [Vibrio sp. JCM 19052]CAH1532021.1 Outer membrane protein N, non-specific porin [Vibrio owensii]CAH1577120.1 Outer membrane protein N, non-specific porin [Vibrio owensii]